MMLYPPMNQLLEKVPSRYMLVNVVAQRARQIASEAENEDYFLEDKPVTLAVQMFASGEQKLSDLNVTIGRQSDDAGAEETPEPVEDDVLEPEEDDSWDDLDEDWA